MDLLLLFVFFASVGAITQKVQEDRVTVLPGLTFEYDYNHYSGYLNISKKLGDTSVHYWFFESQNDTIDDPVIFYVTEATCSSVFKLFEGIGPFRVTKDGNMLYENVFSWNKVSNLLVMDACGVGFTESTDPEVLTDQTISEIYKSALLEFYDHFSDFLNNDLFIAGEGGASHFTARIFNSLFEHSNLGIHPKGLILANEKLDTNIQAKYHYSYAYTHGLYNEEKWNDGKTCCRNESYDVCKDCEMKEYSKFIESAGDESFDFYRSCSKGGHTYDDDLDTDNFTSSDSYRCYWRSAVRKYLNREDVKKIIHVTGKTKVCTKVQYTNTRSSLMNLIVPSIISEEYNRTNGKVLVYNGVTDVVNNFVGAQWFGRSIKALLSLELIHDQYWYFNYDSEIYMSTVGGIETLYSRNLHFVSLLGAGRFAAQTNPAQLLQLINNFLNGHDLSDDLSNIDLEAAPLTEEYRHLMFSKNHEDSETLLPFKKEDDIFKSLGSVYANKKYISLDLLSNWIKYNFVNPGTPPKERQDRILDLPGVPKDIKFRQYSGFLTVFRDNKIHYWLVEAEVNDPSNAPLILSLSGQPTESSLMGLFAGNGPFRISKNGYSLDRNLHSWNKFANILYLDSPVGVGFSYSDMDDTKHYRDDSIAEELYLALQSFFKVYPKYNASDFYIIGETNATRYVTHLAARLLNEMFNKEIDINYKGLAFGNGKIDWMSTSLARPYSYYHGLIPLTIFEKSMSNIATCQLDSKCDKTNLTTLTQFGINQVLQTQKFKEIFIMPNIYQQCLTVKVPGVTRDKAIGEGWTGINYDSNDELDSYPCHMNNAVERYLQRNDVRSALNIPINSPEWSLKTKSDIIYHEDDHYVSIEDAFKNVVSTDIPFKIMYYTGDLDFMNNYMDVSLFTSSYFGKQNFTVLQSETEWTFRDPESLHVSRSGNYKKYVKENFNVDVVSVKGAGSSTALDRPRETFQLIFNFVNGLDYSSQYSENKFSGTIEN